MNNNENNDLMNIKPMDNQGNTMDPNPTVNHTTQVTPIMENANVDAPSINSNITDNNASISPMMNQTEINTMENSANMQTIPTVTENINPVEQIPTGMQTTEEVVPQMKEATAPVVNSEVPNNTVPMGNQNMSVPPMMNQTINNSFGHTTNEQNQPIPESTVPPIYNQNMNVIPPSNNTSLNRKPSFIDKYGKYLLIALFVILVGAACYFLFSGKKLTCTLDDEYSGVKLSQTVQVKFSGNKANSAKMIVKIDLKNMDDEIKNRKDSIIEGFKENAKDIEQDGVKVDIKETSNTITITATAKDNVLGLLEVSEGQNIYEKIKKQYELGGYTCK